MVDVAGGGHIGLAIESTHGTYEAPAIYAPVTSESLAENRNDPVRKPILGQAVTLGKVKGREWVEGEITMEALPLPMVYMMAASRWDIVKSGAGPYVYTATDSALAHQRAVDERSLTIVADRAGVGFAYVGCQVTSQRFFIEDGIPMVAYGIIGREQTEDYTPGSVTIPSETPFGADEIALTIATLARCDIDSLEFNFDDNGEARFNLCGNEGADYVKFGEFNGTASFEADFESKADYALWVARTSQEIKAVWTKGASQAIDIEIHGGIYDTYEVGLSAMGDQVRAQAEIMAVYASGDSAAATIALTTATDVTEIT